MPFVQADQTLPIGSKESFTCIIPKTSHFVWSTGLPGLQTSIFVTLPGAKQPWFCAICFVSPGAHPQMAGDVSGRFPSEEPQLNGDDKWTWLVLVQLQAG